MRESWTACRMLFAIGFQAAPRQAAVQLLTGLVMALTGPALAYGAKLLVDAAVTGELTLGLAAAATLALTVALGLATTFYYVDALFTVIERAGSLVSRRLMQLLGQIPGLGHFESPEYLDQVQRVREDRDSLTKIVNASAGLLRAAVTFTATAVLLARLHPILLLLPAVGLLSFWLAKRSREIAVAAQEATSEPERLRRHLFEVGTAAPQGKELRMFGLTDVVLHRHHEAAEAVLHVRNGASWRGAVFGAADGLISTLAFIGAIALVLMLAVEGRATPGDVVLAIALAGEMSGIIFVAVAYGNSFLRVMKAARRLLWLEEYARGADRPAAGPVPAPARLTGGIDLQDVTFQYPGTGRPVLDGLSLHLPAGKVVALVGENGAGKTTLVKLLCDFYRPDSGQVLVDGLDLATFPTDTWRQRVSAAYQDFARFEFLARETVGIADLPRMEDREAVAAALERGGATGVVDRLPRGLDSQLGTAWEDGVELSGGQWQKLALARGLMRDPLLVVFDEPTAALDPQTEHSLFERFAEAARSAWDRGTVTLLVTHRFSTVRMADLIVVLDGGRVREYGSHEELLAMQGQYAELYELQSKAYR